MRRITNSQPCNCRKEKDRHKEKRGNSFLSVAGYLFSMSLGSPKNICLSNRRLLCFSVKERLSTPIEIHILFGVKTFFGLIDVASLGQKEKKQA